MKTLIVMLAAASATAVASPTPDAESETSGAGAPRCLSARSAWNPLAGPDCAARLAAARALPNESRTGAVGSIASRSRVMDLRDVRRLTRRIPPGLRLTNRMIRWNALSDDERIAQARGGRLPFRVPRGFEVYPDLSIGTANRPRGYVDLDQRMMIHRDRIPDAATAGMRHVWATARVYFDGAMPLTRIVSDSAAGGAFARVAVATADDASPRGWRELDPGERVVEFTTTAALAFLRGGDYAESTLLHEWAHVFQNMYRWPESAAGQIPQTLVEGGADGFAMVAGPAIYRHARLRHTFKAGYPASFRAEALARGRHWILEGQFATRGVAYQTRSGETGARTACCATPAASHCGTSRHRVATWALRAASVGPPPPPPRRRRHADEHLAALQLPRRQRLSGSRWPYERVAEPRA